MNSRGNFLIDIILICVIVFVMAITFIFVRRINTPINQVVQNIDGIPDEIKESSADFENNNAHYWDGAFIMMFLAMLLLLWWSVWVIDTHPFFFIIMFIIVGILTLITAILNNVFIDIFSNNEMSSTAAEFVIIPFFMENYVYIMIGVAFVTLILLYAKTRNGN